MALQNGQLLVRRMQIVLPNGDTEVDTGLTEVDLDVDPPVGGVEGVTASRVQVAVLPPTPGWANLTISEPTLNANGTVSVTFTNSGAQTTINVLFWLPHTMPGPISADLYTIPAPDCLGGFLPIAVEQALGVTTGDAGG